VLGTELRAIGAIGRVQPGEKVLVTGAGGGLGIHDPQLARLAGAFVVAQTTSPSKVGALLAAGAHEVVADARGSDFAPELRDESGRGVDVEIDNVETPQFQATRRSLAPGGRWIMVGQLSGEFTPFNPAELFLRSISLLGATVVREASLRDLRMSGNCRRQVSATRFCILLIRRMSVMENRPIRVGGRTIWAALCSSRQSGVGRLLKASHNPI